jgi:hypothetical protein
MSNFDDILNYFFCGTKLPQVKAELVVPGIKIPVDCLSSALLIYLDKAFEQSRQSIKVPSVLSCNEEKLKEQQLQTSSNSVGSNFSDTTEEMLKQLLKDNPICTSAVSYCDDHFCVSTVATRNETLLTKLMSAYDPCFPRVHARFDVLTWELCSAEIIVENKTFFQYSNSTSKDDHKFLNRGSDATTHNEEDSFFGDEPVFTKEKVFNYLLFSLLLYVEVIRVTLHVFELLMVTGITHAMESLPGHFLKPLKDQLNGICVQAKETEGLFARNGLLCGGGCWKADRAAVLQFMKTDLLTKWFHYNSADEFVQDFIFHNIPRKHRGNLAEEYLKHIRQIREFTPLFCKALYQSNGGLLINPRLETFMKLIGRGVSTITTLEQWFSVFGALGYFHQSVTRISSLLLRSEILSLLFPEMKKTSSETNTSNNERLHVLLVEYGPWATTTGLCALFPEIFQTPKVESQEQKLAECDQPVQPVGRSSEKESPPEQNSQNLNQTSDILAGNSPIPSGFFTAPRKT